MTTRGTRTFSLTLALPLALLLGGATACSSEQADSSGPDTTRASTSSSPAPTTPAQPTQPAVSIVGHGGAVGTYCQVPNKKGDFPDFVWTGIRLKVRQAASITAVRLPRHRVAVLHTWVVEGGNGNTGAIVPWSARNTFLRHLDWKHRTAATGADLTPGSAYTLVFRLRPRNGGELHDVAVRYRSAAGDGSDRDPDTLKFDRSC